MPLTDTAIRQAKPADKPLRMFDGDGLDVEVAPGGGEWWRLKFRIQGKEKRLSLDVYPKVGLKEARRKCEDARRVLSEGRDPSAERRAEKLRAKAATANSFEAVAREWYGKQVHTWVPHHADDVRRRLEMNTFPFIGARPIDEIEAPELLAAMRKIEERGAHDLALRVLEVVGQILRYGIAASRCARRCSGRSIPGSAVWRCTDSARTAADGARLCAYARTCRGELE